MGDEDRKLEISGTATSSSVSRGTKRARLGTLFLIAAALACAILPAPSGGVIGWLVVWVGFVVVLPGSRTVRYGGGFIASLLVVLAVFGILAVMNRQSPSEIGVASSPPPGKPQEERAQPFEPARPTGTPARTTNE